MTASATAYLQPDESRPGSSARGLHHFAVVARDVEETVRFYQDVLEFPLTDIFENRDYPGSNHFFFDIGNDNLIAFFDFPGLDVGPYAEVLGGLHHIAISVEPEKWAAAEGQARRGRCRLPERERHLDLLPRPQRRPARADRRPAGGDVRHEGPLTCHSPDPAGVSCLDERTRRRHDRQHRIPAAEMTGLYGAVLKRFSKKMLGEVPESLGVMWHNKQVMKSASASARRSRKWSQVDEDLKSFAHMAVASLIGCTWCLDHGYFQAHNDGLDETKAREVPRWRESDVFTPLERDVMDYAESMSMTPPTVTDELSARLLEQLGAAGLLGSRRGSGWRTSSRAATSPSASRPRASRRPAAWRLWRSRAS